MNEIKNKADELISKFEFCYVSPLYLLSAREHAKQCALILCDEMLEQCNDANFGGFGLYWQQVKSYIENNY